MDCRPEDPALRETKDPENAWDRNADQSFPKTITILAEKLEAAGATETESGSSLRSGRQSSNNDCCPVTTIKPQNSTSEIIIHADQSSSMGLEIKMIYPLFMSDLLATIAQLYFYPVKSMAGIPLQQAYVGLDGIIGDRQYAFVQAKQAATNSFPWMTARQSSRMLLYQPQLAQLPTPEEQEPVVHVRTSEGNVCEVTDPALCDEIASLNGSQLFLLKSNRGNFDAQHLSLFSLLTVDALATEAESTIDHRQFRANIYIQPVSKRPFDEENWAGSLLQIGDSVLVGVTKRDGRCMIVNLNPENGEQNPAILRTIVQRHEQKVGVYGNILRRGLIRVGDEIRLVTKC